MKTLPKTVLISTCIALMSVSAQAANYKKQLISACDLSNVKNMSQKQIRLCEKNTKGKEQRSWIKILTNKIIGADSGDGSI